MLNRRVLTGFVWLFVCAAGARAGTVITFTDFDSFLEVAGDVREIDFETLPDGSPSVVDTLITPDFNYTNHGVSFFSPEPHLFISGNAETGFNVTAGQFGSGGPRNWIIAELAVPSPAVGVSFPGGTRLSIFDATAGGLIASQFFGGSGTDFFLGFVSDVPIGSATMDSGTEVEVIHSFFFVPVPEPATLVLLVVGAACLMHRRRR